MQRGIEVDSAFYTVCPFKASPVDENVKSSQESNSDYIADSALSLVDNLNELKLNTVIELATERKVLN